MSGWLLPAPKADFRDWLSSAVGLKVVPDRLSTTGGLGGLSAVPDWLISTGGLSAVLDWLSGFLFCRWVDF